VKIPEMSSSATGRGQVASRRCCLGRVDGRAAAHRDETVPRALLAGVAGRLVHAVVGGLDVHAVEDLRGDAVLAHRLRDAGRDAQLVDPRIGQDEHPPGPELGHLEADLVHGPGAELQRRRAPGEDGLFGKVRLGHQR
jgi:hypothetical protein